MSQKINLGEKLSQFEGHWQPRVVGAFNGHDLMVVKFQGQFPWRKHDDTDDFFLVLKSDVIIRLRELPLKPGEIFVAPKRRACAVRRTRSARAADRADRHAELRRFGDCGAAAGNLR